MTRAEEKYIKYFDDDFKYPHILNALQSLENEMQQENEQLKVQFDKLKEGKQYETCPYRSTDMGCDYCDYRDRDLKDEWEENDR